MITIISAKQAKNGSLTSIFIDGKFLEIATGINVNVRNDISTVTIRCIDIDVENKEDAISKMELIKIFEVSRRFAISYINEDSEVEINKETIIKNCKCEGYSFLSICGDVQKINFNATFNKHDIEYK